MDACFIGRWSALSVFFECGYRCAESVADAVKEFKATLLNDFGFELTDAGIKSIEAGCKERLTAAL
eukprot:COSAG01_NODE_21337_length_906_cov_2.372986_2_plen_66_part_00